MKIAVGFAVIFILLMGFIWAVVFDGMKPSYPSRFEPLSLPGKLSHSHAFLEKKCDACHESGMGVAASKCIVCHANDKALLQRQSTSFHASIKSCKECHQEHVGGLRPLNIMDHGILAKVGLREKTLMPSEESLSGQARDWVRLRLSLPKMSQRGLISHLDCISCHRNQDRHRELFGKNCIACHTTESWQVRGYRHPSPTNRQCVQCHQAPPSHYMEHFEMVSMKVAGQEHANVKQCYLCHQTNSWNDIRGVGWYKHH